MRLKAFILVSALAATAMPAFAQDQLGRSCQQARSDNQVGGMILGGILGGVLGSQVAAPGHRSDGSAVGAVLGGIVGSGMGKGSVQCAPQTRYAPGSSYYPNPNYGGPNYNDYGYSPYGAPSYGYDPAPVTAYPSAPGYSPPRYADDDWYPSDTRTQRRYRDDRDMTRSGDYAGQACDEAVQITKLPDGSEVRRPIEVCRDAYYGDWQIRD